MIAEDIIRRYSALKNDRAVGWEALWRDVRKYVYPNYSEYSETAVGKMSRFDNTAITARSKQAAGIYAWMAPPNQRWFMLSSVDDEQNKDSAIKSMLAERGKIIAEAMANSNWPSVLSEALNELVSVGTMIVFMQEKDGKLAFTTIPVEQVVLAEDSFGQVDTVFREYSITARNMVDFFRLSSDVLPEEVIAASKDDRRKDQKFTVLHAVFPRPKADVSPGDKRNVTMKIASCYIDLKTKTIIQESGFNEMPYAVCRYLKMPNTVYGHCPGIDELPNIRMLNRFRECYLYASEISADPPWLVPDGSLVDKNLNSSAGGLIVYKPTIERAVPQPVPPFCDFSKMMQDIQLEREAIKLGFCNDIFDPLQDLSNITATEAEIREAGKIIPFAPVVGNLSTFFDAVILRCHNLIERMNAFPEAVENTNIKVDYVSKIALSIKKLEALGFIQAQQLIAPVIQIAPESVDNVDYDKVTREIIEASGAAPGWLRSEKEVKSIREERNKQIQQQQQIEAATQLASAIPAAGKAPEPGSMLANLSNGMGV